MSGGPRQTIGRREAPGSDFMLTESEKAQPLWLKLKEHWIEQLLDLRARNDGPLSELETATLRGQIKCLRSNLALGESQPLLGDQPSEVF